MSVPAAPDVHSAPLSLSFLERLPVPGETGVLGVIGYGAGLSPLPGIPYLPLDLPPLDKERYYEVWTAGAPVHYERMEGVTLAATESLLFGALQAAEEPGIGLEMVARTLYERLFRVLAAHGYAHLLRVWNYFPRITAPENGLERYQRFTLGRHEAFLAQARPVETAPAACAIGSQGGPLSVLFLAAKEPGQPIENPRQVSAYRYPAQYGPRSPTFSRALLAKMGGRAQLFISGTASIVGHESRHQGDPGAQAEEAMTNVGMLLAEARDAGLAAKGRLLLKTYVRHPSMLEAIRPAILAKLGPDDRAIFLKADICRPELLVEIEGAYL